MEEGNKKKKVQLPVDKSKCRDEVQQSTTTIGSKLQQQQKANSECATTAKAPQPTPHTTHLYSNRARNFSPFLQQPNASPHITSWTSETVIIFSKEKRAKWNRLNEYVIFLYCKHCLTVWELSWEEKEHILLQNAIKMNQCLTDRMC